MPDINVNKLSEAINTKADIDLNNTGVFSTSEGGGVSLTSSTPADASGKEVTSADFIKSDIQSNLLNYTTNRILEIPQDIKLELNNGTLTLKAGSKVYVPNGFEADGTTPKFDVVTIESDKVWGSRNLDYPQQFVFLQPSQAFEAVGESSGTVYSGSTAPSGKQYILWYDTTNNFIKWTNNFGSSWVSGNSFPLSICSSTQANNWTSIDQVFNGLGYIGSTVFALPGVKVLIPNGKNEDGTYKSFIYTIASVLTYNLFNNQTVVNGKAVIVPDTGNVLYRESTNLQFDSITGYMNRDIHRKSCIIANVSWTTNGINSFEPYTVDSVLNSNASNFSQAGRSYLSGLGMPSGRYIDLTLGASGSTYTAPANGWFVFGRKTTNPAGCGLSNQTTGIGCSYVVERNWTMCANVPAKKGDVVSITYWQGDSTTIFRFIYAEGENS